MENQHRKISGYRELNQEEIDLMNEIKAKGLEIGDLIEKAIKLPGNGVQASERGRWATQAQTTLQTGIMQLVRAVALPAGF